MSVTISWEPSLLIPTPTRYRVSRKANTGTPLISWAESEFVELEEITSGSPLPTTHTDSDGNADYWYRVETGDASRYAPPSWPIPGHMNYSFASLRVGVGWLSNFMPNSLGSSSGPTEAALLFDAELRATWYTINTYLRGRYEDHTIFEEFFKDPPPNVRKITELLAAIELTAQYKPTLEEELKTMQREFERVVRVFTTRKGVMMGDLVKQAPDKIDPAEPGLTWDR